MNTNWPKCQKCGKSIDMYNDHVCGHKIKLTIRKGFETLLEQDCTWFGTLEELFDMELAINESNLRCWIETLETN